MRAGVPYAFVRAASLESVQAGGRPPLGCEQLVELLQRAAADQRDGAIEGIPDTKQQSLQ
jgi:hypothetical protein